MKKLMNHSERLALVESLEWELCDIDNRRIHKYYGHKSDRYIGILVPIYKGSVGLDDNYRRRVSGTEENLAFINRQGFYLYDLNEFQINIVDTWLLHLQAQAEFLKANAKANDTDSEFNTDFNEGGA